METKIYLPKKIKEKIKFFKPEFSELSFKSMDKLNVWLKEKTKIHIVFDDWGQDLLNFQVSESGEIIATRLPSLGEQYNGALVLNDLDEIQRGDTVRLFLPKTDEVIKVNFHIKTIIRFYDSN